MNKYGLTLQQQNIWEMTKRYEGSCIGNSGGIMHLKKGIPDEVVLRALKRLCHLNPALRLRVDTEGMQYVSEWEEILFETIDCRKEGTDGMERIFRRLMDIPVFAYDRPLVRFYLVKGREKNHVLGVFHHLVCDGVGLQRITEQFGHLSRDENDPLWDESLTPDNRFILYLDQYQVDEIRYKRSLDWYKSRYENAKLVYPLRRTGESIRAEIRRKTIAGEQYRAFQNWQNQYQCTVEQLFEAAYAVYQSRITASPVVSIGRVLINRKKSYIDTAGMFANALPLLIRVDVGDTFSDLCRQIKTSEFEMIKHSGVKGSDITCGGAEGGRLYDFCISYRPSKRLPKDGERIADECEASVIELPLRLVIDDRPDQILLTYKYMAERYTRQEIEDFNEVLLAIIKTGAEKASAHICSGAQYDILSAREKQQRTLLRDAAYEHSPVRDILELFYETVEKNPARPLWTDCPEGGIVTFGEAGKLVWRLAARLCEAVISGSGDTEKKLYVAALKTKRTHRMPLAMLACLKAGVAFYPVDISENEERLEAIRGDCDILLTDGLIDKWLQEKELSGNMLPCRQTEIAYHINTSGSTGTPKIVQIKRDALNIRLSWMREKYQMDGCRVLQKTKNTFDVSVWELLLPAMSEGTLFLLADGDERDPGRIADVMIRHRITDVHFVPSMLSAFVSWVEARRMQEEIGASLKNIFSSGEELGVSLAAKTMENFPSALLHNLYGPAECTIDVSFHECTQTDICNKLVPIGLPVWDTELLIVNRDGCVLPDGYVGEIVIGGLLVGNGYYKNEALSEKHFAKVQTLPCGKNAGRTGRLYYTGDTGYKLTNGEIVYVGRKDREVKVRGKRVQLSMLENEAMKLPGVKAAAVMLIGCALVLIAETAKTEKDVREGLAGRVPGHYVPDVIVMVDEMPYRANGKCDYDRLKELYRQKRDTDVRGERNAAVLPSVAMHRCLQESFFRATGCRNINSDEDLFAWGMDSISAIHFLTELEKRGVSVTYRELYHAKTMIGVMKLLEDRKKKQTKGIVRRYPDWNCEGISVGEAHTPVVIGVPYAGTDAHIFDKYAECITRQGCLFFACDIAVAEADVEGLAARIIDEIHINRMEKSAADVTVVGCCVGGALAIELVRRMQVCHGIKSKLILIASLPTYYSDHTFFGAKDNRLWWEKLPKKMSDIIFSGLHGKCFSFTDEMLEQLIGEAKIYINYFEMHKNGTDRADAETVMVFGTKDYFTFGFRKKYKMWKRYLTGPVKIRIISGGRHFLTGSHAELLAEYTYHCETCP